MKNGQKRKQSRTCIAVAKNRKGKIMMAGDRRASWDWDYCQDMPRPKIRNRNGLLLGASGDGNLCTYFVDNMPIPNIDTDDTDVYIHNDFKMAMFKQLQANNYTDEHGLLRIPSDTYCAILVAIRGKCYLAEVVSPDQDISGRSLGQIIIDEVGLPFAIGCGAMASIVSLLKDHKVFGYSTKDHLIEAVEWACKISPGCGLPDGKKPDYIVED